MARKYLAALACVIFLLTFIPSALAATKGPGVPASLYVQSLPPTLPADGKSYRSIVVSLLDSGGNPSLALSAIVISLSSSQLNVGTINSTITIPPGHDYAIATMTTSNIPGSTEVTATSPGLQSGFSPVGTATPSGLASRLKVFPVPTEPVAGSTGLLVVELQDDTGLPAKSATDVSIQLSSTNPSVATVSQPSVTIPGGQFFTEVAFTTSQTSGGFTTISAFAAGYTSGQAGISLITNGVTGIRVVLKSIFQPLASANSILPADGQAYNALLVTLVDLKGLPVPAPASGVQVQLSSSRNTIIGVNANVMIPSGSASIFTTLQTGIQQGTANITAFAQGYLGSSVLVSAVIPAPSRIAVYVDPSTKILTGLTTPLLVVQLQDASGQPARAKQATSVLITSSNDSVVQGSFRLNMSRGDDFISTFLSIKGGGAAVLTGTSSGLISARGILVNVITLPLLTTLTPSPSIIRLNGTSSVTLGVELLNQPLAGANVTWLVSGGEVSQINSVTSSQGIATVVFRPFIVGAANVTALVYYPAIGETKSTVFVLVNANPPPQPLTLQRLLYIYWYLEVIVIAVAVVYLVFYVRRRRARARMELEAAFQTVS